MRHQDFSTLKNPGYYVVFCDCDCEIKRFYPDNNFTAKELFEEWLKNSSSSEQYCLDCHQKINLEKSKPTKKEASKSPIKSFIDDLSKTYETILADVDPQKASLEAKRETAKQLSHAAATICAALALQPIPIADVLIITPIQILLVQAIGRVYGVPISTKTALEIATNIGLGIALRQIFVALIKVGLPLMGGLLVTTYVYTATFYMGKVAQVYFEKGRPLTKQELEQMQSVRSRAEERLRELDQLKQSNLITEEEYKNKRIKILDEIWLFSNKSS